MTRNVNISDFNISSGHNRFYIFILQRTAKEAPGRFFSPRFLHLDLAFLSADFIMILKDQSMFLASADEISLTTPLFDNLFLLSWNPRLQNTSGLYTDSLLAKKRYP